MWRERQGPYTVDGAFNAITIALVTDFSIVKSIYTNC